MIIRVIYEVDEEATYNLSGEEIQSVVAREMPGQIVLWKKNPRDGYLPEEAGRVRLREISAPEEGEWTDER